MNIHSTFIAYPRTLFSVVPWRTMSWYIIKIGRCVVHVITCTDIDTKRSGLVQIATFLCVPRRNRIWEINPALMRNIAQIVKLVSRSAVKPTKCQRVIYLLIRIWQVWGSA